jgi:hypothetical protein
MIQKAKSAILLTGPRRGHSRAMTIGNAETDAGDRHSLFLIAIGDLCATAALASLEVDVYMSDGGRVHGVPGSVSGAAGAAESDDTGWARMFRVGARLVDLDEVVGAMILRP